VIQRYQRLFFIVVLTILAVPSSGQSDVALLPDLEFHFSCKNVASVSLAGDLGTFLHTLGFRSIDLAKIQAEHGLGIVHSQMEAIDPAKHWVTISSSPRHPDAYGFGLYSTPPTHRAHAVGGTPADGLALPHQDWPPGWVVIDGS
jgi:hypothetical protein